MTKTKLYRVLYFITGGAPSDEQRADIVQYGPNAAFRNAMFVGKEGNPENCTAVAGDVPELYANRFPVAVSYADFLAGLLPEPPAQESPPDFAEDGQDGVSMSSFAGAPSADPFASAANPGAPVRRRPGGREPNWTRNG